MAIGRVGTVLLLAASILMAGPSPSSAADEALTCTVAADRSGFVVEYDGNVEADERVVVERRVFSQYWWRGIVTDRDASGGSFRDGPAPRNAASARYRITVVTADGQRNSTDCSLLSTPGLSCTAELVDGSYRVAIINSLPNGAWDYVVRRSVTPDGPFYWRAVARTAETVIDGASPTGEASYQVWLRDQRVIEGAAACRPVDNSACASPISNGQAAAAAARRGAPVDELVALAPDGFDHYKADNGLVYFLVDNEARPGATTAVELDPATGVRTNVFGFSAQQEQVTIDMVDARGAIYATWTVDGRTEHYDLSNTDAALRRPPTGETDDGTVVFDRNGRLGLVNFVDNTQENVFLEAAYTPFAVGDDALIVTDPSGSFFSLDLDCLQRPVPPVG